MTRDWTGERWETGIANETMPEHLHRYALAAELAAGKTVLDIACGEGYGSWLLAQKATTVTGVDLDEKTIRSASRTYKKENIRFITGSAYQVPAAAQSFDMITCFETLEHLEDHITFMEELKRVLAPGGLLLLSTPDRQYYSDQTGYINPYHKKELYGPEFRGLMKSYFTYTVFLEQASFTGSLIRSDTGSIPAVAFTGDHRSVKRIAPLPYVYLLAIASDQEVPALPSSFFIHPDKLSQLQYREAEKVKDTLTYRVGNLLLGPFKFIRRLFKK